MFNGSIFVVKPEPEELATRRARRRGLVASCSASPGDTKGNQRAGQESKLPGFRIEVRAPS